MNPGLRYARRPRVKVSSLSRGLPLHAALAIVAPNVAGRLE